MSVLLVKIGSATLTGISGRSCSVVASLTVSEIESFKVGRGIITFETIAEGMHYLGATNDLKFTNGARAKIIIEEMSNSSAEFVTDGPVYGATGVPV